MKKMKLYQICGAALIGLASFIYGCKTNIIPAPEPEHMKSIAAIAAIEQNPAEKQSENQSEKQNENSSDKKSEIISAKTQSIDSYAANLTIPDFGNKSKKSFFLDSGFGGSQKEKNKYLLFSPKNSYFNPSAISAGSSQSLTLKDVMFSLGIQGSPAISALTDIVQLTRKMEFYRDDKIYFGLNYKILNLFNQKPFEKFSSNSSRDSNAPESKLILQFGLKY